jgi:hypothetical protein
MDILQFLLQLSLFLFSIGIITSFWGADWNVQWVTSGFILFGAVAWVGLCVVARHEDCPFQMFISARPKNL